jgi:hypothetical protein
MALCEALQDGDQLSTAGSSVIWTDADEQSRSDAVERGDVTEELASSVSTVGSLDFLLGHVSSRSARARCTSSQLSILLMFSSGDRQGHRSDLATASGRDLSCFIVDSAGYGS